MIRACAQCGDTHHCLTESVDYFPDGQCPYCHGSRLLTSKGDSVFHPRVGCLDCDRWLTKVRLK